MKVGTIVRRKKIALGIRLWPHNAPDILWRVYDIDSDGYIYVHDKYGNLPNPKSSTYRWLVDNFHIIQET